MTARKKAEPKPVQVESEPKAQEKAEPKPKDQDIGGLAALQARFDAATEKGYFGPEKEDS